MSSRRVRAQPRIVVRIRVTGAGAQHRVGPGHSGYVQRISKQQCAQSADYDVHGPGNHRDAVRGVRVVCDVRCDASVMGSRPFVWPHHFSLPSCGCSWCVVHPCNCASPSLCVLRHHACCALYMARPLVHCTSTTSSCAACVHVCASLSGQRNLSHILHTCASEHVAE